MATRDELTADKPPSLSSSEGDYITEKGKPLDDAPAWIDYAIEQAVIAQKTVEDALESAISLSRSRFDEIRSTSSAHFQMTLNSLQDFKSEFNVYEDIAFGKIKEGIFWAASHPFITSGVVFGSGLLALKRPRRYLYYNSLRLFVSEEALISKANGRVEKLRQSVHSLKAEYEKLERMSSIAEEELKRGRTKLRQAGNQIQWAIRSTYKIERQAAGLKDVLKELPSGDASRFRSQVTNLALEVKRERIALSKEVRKISNYGISV